MNIAIDIRSLLAKRESGVTVYTRELLGALFSGFPEQHFVLYFNTFDSKITSKLTNEFSGIPNVEIVSTSYPNKLFNPILSFFRYPKIDKIIQKQTGKKVDILFVPDPRPSPVSKACKKITTFHDLSFEHFKQTFSWKTRLWHQFILKPRREAEETDLIIAVSEATKEDLMQTYDINKNGVCVIHEGVSENFRSIKYQVLGIKEKYTLPEKFFLSLSTLESRKNLQMLIDAFCEWKDNTDHPHSLVIGGIENYSIFSSKHKLSIPEKHKQNIIFAGYIDSEDKPALYSMADALYFISLYEGFGLPIVEAMACETPVVTSNLSSMKEIAGDACLLVDPKNKTEVSSSFDIILKEGGSYRHKGEERVKDFSWEKCAQKTMDTIKKVTKT